MLPFEGTSSLKIHLLLTTKGIVVPAGYTTPSFPSLYPPSLENTEDERGVFLYEAESELAPSAPVTPVITCVPLS